MDYSLQYWQSVLTLTGWTCIGHLNTDSDSCRDAATLQPPHLRIIGNVTARVRLSVLPASRPPNCTIPRIEVRRVKRGGYFCEMDDGRRADSEAADHACSFRVGPGS